MKIALLGYGKMGRTIQKILAERQHQLVMSIDSKNLSALTIENLKMADVAIEFSEPRAAVRNYMLCFQAGIPVVSGTTGWLDQLAEVHNACLDQGGAFFYASNFSIGVNIFFEVNKKLAKLMNDHPQYQIQLEEIHHTQKLDAPSGTAISLAKDILNKVDHKERWVNESSMEDEELPIISKREENIPGTHTVQYLSAIDTIEITHRAHSRLGFAQGALTAAEWLVGKKGIYSMADMLNLGNE